MFYKRIAAIVAVALAVFAWTLPAPRDAAAQVIGGVSNFFLATGTGAISRTFNSKLAEIGVSVKDYGATGDGVTDDTAAITAAYTALTPNDAIFFPQGTYLITTQLDFSDSKNVKIYGAGPGASKIVTASATALGGAPFWCMVKISNTGAGRKSISDLTIGRVTAPGATIANDNGVCMGPVQNIVNINNVTIENLGANGILHRGNSASVNIMNSSIRENHFGWGIWGDGAAAAVQNLSIVGNSIFGNDGGIRIDSSFGVTIMNNDIEGCGMSGAACTAAGLPTKQMIKLAATTGNNVWVFGNTLGFATSATATEVVLIESVNVYFAGNTIAQGVTNKHAIRLKSGAVGNVFSGNQISAVGAGSGTGNAWLIEAGANSNRFEGTNYGNTWTTAISDSGAGNIWLTGGTHNQTQFIIQNTAATGDKTRLSPGAASAGITVDVVNNATTDYTPFNLYSSQATFQCRTGVGTVAACATFSTDGIIPRTQTFATLGTPGNGNMAYCSDCTFANPCASGGTGAIAKRLNGAWRCD